MSNPVWMFHQYGQGVLQRLDARYGGTDATAEDDPSPRIHLKDLCETTGDAPSDLNWFDGLDAGVPQPPALNTLPEPQNAPPPNHEVGPKRAHVAPKSVGKYAKRVRKKYPKLEKELSARMALPENAELLAQLNETAAAAVAARVAEALFPKKVQYSANAEKVAEQLTAQRAETEKARERLKAAKKAVQDAKAYLASETESLNAKQEELDIAIQTGNDIKRLVELRETNEVPAACLVAWAQDAAN